MSEYVPNPEERLYLRAFSTARGLFPSDKAGKYFREPAKVLCRNTSLTYEQALAFMLESARNAAASAIMHDLKDVER